MLESSLAAARQSTEITRMGVRRAEQKFGLVARALWPRKTAAELASRCDCTQRTAELWLSGYEPSARALAVIIAEFLA